MIKFFDADVYAFDPTPKSIEWVKHQDTPDKFHFYPVGLDAVDGKKNFHLPSNEDYVFGSVHQYGGVKEDCIEFEMKCLRTVMDELGHDHVDILKMDIEGSEFDVIPEILKMDCEISQICMETHARFFSDGRNKMKDLIGSMNSKGYFVAAISDDTEVMTFIKRVG